MEAGGLEAAAGGGLTPMALVRHHGVLPRLHASAYVAPGAQLVGEVLVGEDSSIWFNAVLRGDINRVVVGDRTNIQDGSVVHVTSALPALIGSDVTVGHMAMIHGCRIEDACLIGMNAIVLDGAVVGPGALVAAGSVVREGFIVPPGMLVAGVPAKIVRELTASERQEIVQSAVHYVEYARSYQQPPQGEQTS